MNELQRNLRSHGIMIYAIQEFRGSEEFYSQRKFTPDVNLLRALNFMREFVQVAYDNRTDVVLVDRGLFDTHCWVKWFATFTEVPKEYYAIIESLLNSVKLFASRYRIIWMDRSPLEALRNHGQKAGRIVNFANLSSLRGIYETELAQLGFQASFHRMESDSGNAQQVAAHIASQLKLT
jgi:hypothetical protein